MRLLESKQGWFVIGPGGVAVMPRSAVTPDRELTSAAFDQLAKRNFFDERIPDTYHLTVLTATGCNLGCSYCFQNTAPALPGRHNPPRIRSVALSAEVTTSILEFAARNMQARGYVGLHILLFGGEPLLNVQGTLELLERARLVGLRSAEMVTNGTLLTPRVAAKLDAAGLTKVQITFDGDQTSHDQLRVTRAGRPTFEKILTNVTRAAATTNFGWTFRVNVADPSALDAQTLLARLAATLDPSTAMVSFHLIDDVGVGFEELALDPEATVTRFDDWYRLASSYGFKVPIAGPRKHCVYCSAKDGRDGAVVNADGVLYSCWESAGKPGWEVGTVDGGYLPDETVKDRWVSCGYEAAPRWSADDRRRFGDRLDVGNLERMLATTGRRP